MLTCGESVEQLIGSAPLVNVGTDTGHDLGHVWIGIVFDGRFVWRYAINANNFSAIVVYNCIVIVERCIGDSVFILFKLIIRRQHDIPNHLRPVYHLMVFHHNCFHLFLTTRVRITDIGIDHGIITANFFPIADFASIYFDHLLIGKIANRILRIDEEYEGILRHRIGQKRECCGSARSVVLHPLFRYCAIVE